MRRWLLQTSFQSVSHHNERSALTSSSRFGDGWKRVLLSNNRRLTRKKTPAVIKIFLKIVDRMFACLALSSMFHHLQQCTFAYSIWLKTPILYYFFSLTRFPCQRKRTSLSFQRQYSSVPRVRKRCWKITVFWEKENGWKWRTVWMKFDVSASDNAAQLVDSRAWSLGERN